MINLLTLDLGDMDLSLCLLQIFHVTPMHKYPQIWPLAFVLEFTDCKVASPCVSGQGGTWPQLGNPSFFTRESAGPQQQGKQKVAGDECGRESDDKIFCSSFGVVQTCTTNQSCWMLQGWVPHKCLAKARLFLGN